MRLRLTRIVADYMLQIISSMTKARVIQQQRQP